MAKLSSSELLRGSSSSSRAGGPRCRTPLAARSSPSLPRLSRSLCERMCVCVCVCVRVCMFCFAPLQHGQRRRSPAARGARAAAPAPALKTARPRRGGGSAARSALSQGSLLSVTNCLRVALEADPSGRRACLWRQRREEACPVCL